VGVAGGSLRVVSTFAAGADARFSAGAPGRPDDRSLVSEGRSDADAPHGESPHRDRIIDGALACLARLGTSKTTVEDIARQSGLSRATVYRVFPGGRDELLAAVIDTEAARLFSALGVRLGTARSLPDALAGGIAEASARLRDHAALRYLVEHEPELILGHLAFEDYENLLEVASSFTAPFLARWMRQDEAERVAEWAAGGPVLRRLSVGPHRPGRTGPCRRIRPHLHAAGHRGTPRRLEPTDRYFCTPSTCVSSLITDFTRIP